MSRISYIHGVPSVRPDEMRDRGANIGVASEYIPYLAMTQGEMQLALIRQQAQVFAQYYPDQPKHAAAVRMLDNALYGGIHGRRAMVGVIPNTLQAVARQIAQAARNTRPASGTMFGRYDIMHGISAADEQIITYTEKDCVEYATREANKFYGKKWGTAQWLSTSKLGLNRAKKIRWESLLANCQADKAIEKLLNDKMVGAAHHMVYKSLDPKNPLVRGTDGVIAKRILHLAGIGGLHNATGVAEDQMSAWVETGILRKNAAASFGPVGSIATAFSLSPGGEAEVAKYAANTDQKKAKMQKTGGIQGAAGIGIAPALLIPLLVAAVKLASDILQGINQRKAAAMASANGFGSNAYLADQDDWLKGDGSTPPATTSTTPDWLPLLAVGTGAYLLLND